MADRGLRVRGRGDQCHLRSIDETRAVTVRRLRLRMLKEAALSAPVNAICDARGRRPRSSLDSNAKSKMKPPAGGN